VPGKIHRADRMAATGLYEDGQRGIRRLTDPDLRVKDQDRDGVQAEVLYGVLGASSRLNDPEAAVEVMRVYNEWLADFCAAQPGASRAWRRSRTIRSSRRSPRSSASPSAAAAPASTSPTPPTSSRCGIRYWNPLWEVINASGLPLHFHTVGGYVPDHIRKYR
jgi:hypothetical protein